MPTIVKVRPGETVAQANARDMGATEAEVKSLAPKSYSSGGGGVSFTKPIPAPAASPSQTPEQILQAEGGAAKPQAAGRQPGESIEEYVVRTHPEQYGEKPQVTFGGTTHDASKVANLSQLQQAGAKVSIPEQERLNAQARQMQAQGGYHGPEQEAINRQIKGNAAVNKNIEASVAASQKEGMMFQSVDKFGQKSTLTPQGFADLKQKQYEFDVQQKDKAQRASAGGDLGLRASNLSNKNTTAPPPNGNFNQSGIYGNNNTTATTPIIIPNTKNLSIDKNRISEFKKKYYEDEYNKESWGGKLAENILTIGSPKYQEYLGATFGDMLGIGNKTGLDVVYSRMEQSSEKGLGTGENIISDIASSRVFGNPTKESEAAKAERKIDWAPALDNPIVGFGSLIYGVKGFNALEGAATKYMASRAVSETAKQGGINLVKGVAVGGALGLGAIEAKSLHDTAAGGNVLVDVIDAKGNKTGGQQYVYQEPNPEAARGRAFIDILGLGAGISSYKSGAKPSAPKATDVMNMAEAKPKVSINLEDTSFKTAADSGGSVTTAQSKGTLDIGKQKYSIMSDTLSKGAGNEVGINQKITIEKEQGFFGNLLTKIGLKKNPQSEIFGSYSGATKTLESGGQVTHLEGSITNPISPKDVKYNQFFDIPMKANPVSMDVLSVGERNINAGAFKTAQYPEGLVPEGFEFTNPQVRSYEGISSGAAKARVQDARGDTYSESTFSSKFEGKQIKGPKTNDINTNEITFNIEKGTTSSFTRSGLEPDPIFMRRPDILSVETPKANAKPSAQTSDTFDFGTKAEAPYSARATSPADYSAPTPSTVGAVNRAGVEEAASIFAAQNPPSSNINILDPILSGGRHAIFIEPSDLKPKEAALTASQPKEAMGTMSAFGIESMAPSEPAAPKVMDMFYIGGQGTETRPEQYGAFNLQASNQRELAKMGEVLDLKGIELQRPFAIVGAKKTNIRDYLDTNSGYPVEGGKLAVSDTTGLMKGGAYDLAPSKPYYQENTRPKPIDFFKGGDIAKPGKNELMNPDKTDLWKPDKTDLMKAPKNEIWQPPKDEIWKPPSDDIFKPGFDVPIIPGWGGSGDLGSGSGGEGGRSGGSLKQSTRYTPSILAEMFNISVTPKQARSMGLFNREFSGAEIRPMIISKPSKHKDEPFGTNIFKATKGRGGKINIFRLK